MSAVGPAELSFDDHGGGEDALPLIHGHPFDRTMWKPQAQFAAGLAGLVPDLRGYGSSPPAGCETTFDLFAADFAALLDKLAIRSRSGHP